jgi:alpha-N-arabinofuranosidase
MDGPWQIGAKTAEEYGRIACETAKMMKWMDPSIELVACGSSYRSMPTYGTWERTVLRHCYQHVDYLSLHQYYGNNDGDIPAFLAHGTEMDSFIKEVAGICREIKQEKGIDHDVFLSFDEWNVWYHFQKAGFEPEKWTVGRPIEEEVYDFADALLVGSMLTTLINNADVVKIACLAQLVNTIAPIMTENGGRVWLQTIFYPFLYTSQYGRGTALAAQIDAPFYNCAAGSGIPYLDCAAVLSNDSKSLTLFLVNKNLTEPLETTVSLSGFAPMQIEQCVALAGVSLDTVNTADYTPVLPVIGQTDCRIIMNTLEISLPAASWHMVRIRIE